MGSGSLALLVAAAVACNAQAPPRGPEETCAKQCAARAPQCSSEACAHGCNLVLDRLAEHEGDAVVACIARNRSPCDDRGWARCAALVGPHADGGPPPPSPPPTDLGD